MFLNSNISFNKKYIQNFNCIYKFCDYFINDIPALLKQGIVERFSKTEGKENAEIYYSFLYSFYSIPNIILPLFGGILSDELGIYLFYYFFIPAY